MERRIHTILQTAVEVEYEGLRDLAERVIPIRIAPPKSEPVFTTSFLDGLIERERIRQAQARADREQAQGRSGLRLLFDSFDALVSTGDSTALSAVLTRTLDREGWVLHIETRAFLVGFFCRPRRPRCKTSRHGFISDGLCAAPPG